METVEYKDLSLTAWDVESQARVGSCGAKEEFNRALIEDEMRDAVVMVSCL